MSEKRFRFEKECTENFFTEKGIFYNNERPMGANEIIALLNSLSEENEQLKQKFQRWKNLYEIKDNEVTARVDALNEVCEYYLTEAQFKADTDPNEAVHEVINRILNTEVKW